MNLISKENKRLALLFILAKLFSITSVILMWCLYSDSNYKFWAGFSLIMAGGLVFYLVIKSILYFREIMPDYQPNHPADKKPLINV